MKRTSADIKIGVRPSTKAKYDDFCRRRLMKLVDVADMAIEALSALPRAEQEALIARTAQRRSAPAETAA